MDCLVNSYDEIDWKEIFIKPTQKNMWHTSIKFGRISTLYCQRKGELRKLNFYFNIMVYQIFVINLSDALRGHTL